MASDPQQLRCWRAAAPRTMDSIKSSTDGVTEPEWISCDYVDLVAVKEGAEKILAKESGLDVLMANAGIMAPPPGLAYASAYDFCHAIPEREPPHSRFPFSPDFGVDTSLESTENSMTGARYSAITGQTWTFMPSIGTAAVFSPNGTIVAQIEATEEYPARPIIYHSVNTTGFSDTPAYNVNGEFSWSQMKQFGETYPDYIPHVMGNFTPRRLNSVEQMKKTGPSPLNY